MKISLKIFGIVIAVMLCFALVLCATSCAKDPVDIEGVTLADATYVYDGSAHSIEVSGTLPEGVSVSYTGNGVTNAGEHTVKATVNGGKNYNSFDLTATLTIEKADINATLTTVTQGYTGEAVVIEAEGVPEGVSVEYAYAKDGETVTEAILPGTYTVTATLTGDNYNTQTLTAYINITPAELSGVNVADTTVTYDGNAKALDAVTGAPEGAEVTYTYYVYNEDGTVGAAIDAANVVNAGTYKVVVAVSAVGYNSAEFSANLHINKASLEGVITLSDLQVTFVDGETYSLAVAGEIPSDVTVTYYNNVQTTPGTFKVTAVIEGANYETLTLEATLYLKGSGSSSGLLTPVDPF